MFKECIVGRVGCSVAGMVLCDAQDEDERAGEPEEGGADTGWADGEPRPED